MDVPTPVTAAAAPAPLSRSLRLCDGAERLIVTGFFVRYAWLLLSDYAHTANLVSLLMLASEFLPFLFIVIRPVSRGLSLHPLDWVLGIAGTLAPLMAIPAHGVAPLVPPVLYLGVLLLGLYLQIAAKIVLGTRFGIIAANRGVRSDGPYRFLRHPMYAGYALNHLALLLAAPLAHNALIYSIALCLQVLRIQREERILTADDAYQAFAARVPYRLVPFIY